MSSVYFPPYIRSSADFKSVQSGNWNDSATWAIKLVDGTWSTNHIYYPDCAHLNGVTEGNSVYIEPNHTVTLTENHSCKNLNFIANEDRTKVATGASTLSVYGGLRKYTGTIPGTTGGTATGTTPWITGIVSLKGASRTISSTEWGAQANQFSFTLRIDLTAGQTVTFNGTSFQVGVLEVYSGTILFDANALVRSTKTLPSLLIADGEIIVKNGGILKGGQGFQGSNSKRLALFKVEAGGEWNLNDNGDRSITVAATTVTIQGNTILSGLGNQKFPAVAQSGAAVNLLNNLTLDGSGNKTLVNNVSVTGTYTVTGSAVLVSGAFSLTNP